MMALDGVPSMVALGIVARHPVSGWPGFSASWGRRRVDAVYVTGVAGVVLILLAVLMILGVVPTSPLIIGVMFLLAALGMAGPFIVRAA